MNYKNIYRMKRSTIQYITALVIVLSSLIQVSAQQPVARIGYFMDNSTHKHLLNPALVPARGYISYPGVGAIDFDLRSNLQLQNFIFPGAGPDDPLLTFMSPDVTAQQFLSQLSPENYFKLNQRLSLLSLGFWAGSSFWTFDVATRINAELNLPYDLFAFMKQGMSTSEGNRYEIYDLGVNAELLAETSLGASFKVLDNLRVGIKAKALVGGAKLAAGLDEMIIDMRPDKLTVNSTGLINLYGAGLDFVQDEDGIIEDFDFTTPNMAGLGYGLDLGINWNPFPFLQVSGGIIDIGRITWNQNYNRVARSAGSLTFTGFENISFGEDDGSMEDQIAELVDGMLSLAEFRPSAEDAALIQNLIPTINAGIEAGVLRNKITLGVLYSNRLVPGNSIYEVTGIVNFKPWTGFNIAGSYSLINGVADTFGAAMGLNLGIANIFVAVDHLPIHVTPQYLPLNKLSTHFQLGVSLSLGKMKVRNK